MPKKPNYNFEKRKKEQDKKLKQEEKRRRKRESGTHEADTPDSPAPDEGQRDLPEC